FVVFVCGEDGLVTLDVGNLHQIVTFEDAEKAWVAVERKPRSQHSVRGNRAELQYKVANGTTVIHDTLKARLREMLHASIGSRRKLLRLLLGCQFIHSQHGWRRNLH